MRHADSNMGREHGAVAVRGAECCTLWSAVIRVAYSTGLTKHRLGRRTKICCVHQELSVGGGKKNTAR